MSLDQTCIGDDQPLSIQSETPLTMIKRSEFLWKTNTTNQTIYNSENSATLSGNNYNSRYYFSQTCSETRILIALRNR